MIKTYSQSNTNKQPKAVTCIEKDGGHSDKLIEDYHQTGSLNLTEHFGTFHPIIFVPLGRKYIGSDDDQKPS